jgi:hypothetical protein
VRRGRSEVSFVQIKAWSMPGQSQLVASISKQRDETEEACATISDE